MTHQQARCDRDDVGDRVFSTNMLAGFGNVAENASMDNSSKNEVNMANQDQS